MFMLIIQNIIDFSILILQRTRTQIVVLKVRPGIQSFPNLKYKNYNHNYLPQIEGSRVKTRLSNQVEKEIS